MGIILGILGICFLIGLCNFFIRVFYGVGLAICKLIKYVVLPVVVIFVILAIIANI